MKTRNDDDYWPPRPGSWEEAVDPYEVQWSKVQVEVSASEEQNMPIAVLSENRPNYTIPMSVS